jgi:hypothetical protein
MRKGLDSLIILVAGKAMTVSLDSDKVVGTIVNEGFPLCATGNKELGVLLLAVTDLTRAMAPVLAYKYSG